ncbi:MAG TPA: archease [Streptosporangiaceae bacterium]
MAGERAISGHRSTPHTADIRIEAWAPNREDCLAHAILAMVESFTAAPPGTPTTVRDVFIVAGTAEDELAAALDEVIYQMDVRHEIPLDVRVRRVPSGLVLRLAMADTAALTQTGAVPKATSLHELAFTKTPRGWSCAATLDV